MEVNGDAVVWPVAGALTLACKKKRYFALII
jgi:hypothetical protein